VDLSWHFGPDVSLVERQAFADRKTTYAHRGELINDSKTNFTQRVEVAGRYYYVKRYLIPGKHLRRYLGKSRVAREWRNLEWLSDHEIPIPRPIAMAEGHRWFGDYWGVIVTEEAPQAIDLRKIYRDSRELLGKRSWRLSMLARLAKVVAHMHQQGFIHNDLQWRNVLVSLKDNQVFLIDCPAGRRIYLTGNRRGIVRELAFLDKMAKLALSKTDRLRFYMIYRGVSRLRERDKKEIHRILVFLDKKNTE
jgi:tRNA A-37 threonylcarbamoyl transferase component Bud32